MAQAPGTRRGHLQTPPRAHNPIQRHRCQLMGDLTGIGNLKLGAGGGSHPSVSMGDGFQDPWGTRDAQVPYRKWHSLCIQPGTSFQTLLVWAIYNT